MATYRPIHNRKKEKEGSSKDGKFLVQVEVYQNGQRKHFSTGVRVAPKDWDNKRGEVKNNSLANRKIRERINELERFEVSFPTVHGRPFTLDDFELLKDELVPKQVITFTQYLREQLEADKSKIKPGTHRQRLLIVERLELYNNGPVAFDTFKYAFVVGFDQWLLNNTTLKKESSRKRVHKVIRHYLVRVIHSGLASLQNDPYIAFRIKENAVDKDILSVLEVRKIETLQFSKEKQYLTFYRDAWLFAYYTLLRVSDVVSFTRNHLIEDDKGLYLVKEQEKTERDVRIPIFKLHPAPSQPVSKPEQLLRNYWPQDGKPVFDRSEVKMQKYIKQIFRLVGIRRDKPLTFGCARHTGITHLCTMMPIAFVQRLAGHKKIQTTMQYLHLSNQDLEEGLDRVNW